MLTPEQKENILNIMAKKRQDIVYRDWAKRVRLRLWELIDAGDKVMNNQIRAVITNLKDLESIYTQRITKNSAKSISREFLCDVRAIYRTEKEARTGLSEFLQRKLVGSRF